MRGSLLASEKIPEFIRPKRLLSIYNEVQQHLYFHKRKCVSNSQALFCTLRVLTVSTRQNLPMDASFNSEVTPNFLIHQLFLRTRTLTSQ